MKKENLLEKKFKFSLIIWMIAISNMYIYLFINLNPSITNLQQRSDFFSFAYTQKSINEENSELIYGSEIKGSVITSIKIPKSQISKEFILRFEADTKRIWNHTSITNGHKYYPSKDLRIELIINGEIDEVYNYSNIPKKYYSSKITYNNLIISNRGRRISFSVGFTALSSIKNIEVRLVTNHSLREDKNIFSDYFHNDEYHLTICVGEPDIIFCLSNIIIFLNCYIFIAILILKKNIYNFIILSKYFEKIFHYELKVLNLRKVEQYLKNILKRLNFYMLFLVNEEID